MRFRPPSMNPKDRLTSGLPTRFDPSNPSDQGYPADPKPVSKLGQRDPWETNPPPRDIGRPA
jgi:hypothetical protein